MSLFRMQSFLSIGILWFAASAGAQIAGTPPTAVANDGMPNAFTFDSVSVKAVSANAPVEFYGMEAGPNGIHASGSLVTLLRSAFSDLMRTPAYEPVDGEPEWAQTQRYDIEANLSPVQGAEFKALSRDDQEIQGQRMKQSVLEDQFKVKLHVESQQAQVYELAPAKGGAKLRCAEIILKDGTKAKPGTGGWMQFNGSGKLDGRSFDMVQFASYLSEGWLGLGRRVIDKTGLTGGAISLSSGPPTQTSPVQEAGVDRLLLLRWKTSWG